MFKQGEGPGFGPGRGLETVSKEDDGRGGEKLVCAACGNPVTWERAAVSVQSRHEHVFSNPHGYVYAVRCFGQARGVYEASPKNREFSWFSGYAWSLAVCAACGLHLGWLFSSPTDMDFYGFIRQRLVPERDESG